MKFLFLIIISIGISTLSFGQDDRDTLLNWCSDSIVKPIKNHDCLENNDTLYEWTVDFDSISISVYNRWGNKVRSSSNPYVSISELFNYNSDDAKNKIPEGTYLILLEANTGDERKLFCYYFFLKSWHCGCG
ncbi:MAG: gliding motility-associated C-terminal domain-containing protein [Flavobacteriales bacterium]